MLVATVALSMKTSIIYLYEENDINPIKGPSKGKHGLEVVVSIGIGRHSYRMSTNQL